MSRTFLRALYELFHLIFTAILLGRYYYDPIEDEPAAQRGLLTHPRPVSELAS